MKIQNTFKATSSGAVSEVCQEWKWKPAPDDKENDWNNYNEMNKGYTDWRAGKNPIRKVMKYL